MNRIDRLSAILIQLQSRRLVKAYQIADKFNISLRTVYRDVHALQEAGVPVIGEAGTGYSLMEGYKLPPVLFTQEEATALLTAAKLMASKTDQQSSNFYSTALDKIRAVLRTSEKDHVEDIDERVAVVQHPSIQYVMPANLHLQTILKAIASSSVVEMKYMAVEKNDVTKRKADPIGIYYQGSHWYLVAFCHLRNDYRNFRTDRIASMAVTAERASLNHPPLQEFIFKASSKKELVKVVIDVPFEIVKYFGEQKFYNGFIKEEIIGNDVRMTFLSGSLTGFARWFMLFGDHAKIVEPQELNHIVAGIASKILKKLKKAGRLLT